MLKESSFNLSPTELEAINRHIRERANAIAAAGEESPMEVAITFSFSAPFGRTVHVRVDGEVVGVDI